MTLKQYEDKLDEMKKELKDSQKFEEANRTDKRTKENEYSTANVEKTNFEKRLAELLELIYFLKGTANQQTSNANNKAIQAKIAYETAIKTDSAPSDVANAFGTQTIESDNDSRNALDSYEHEARQLEQQIDELKRRLSALNEQIYDLNRQIRACDSMQDTLKWDIKRTQSIIDDLKKK